MRSTPGGIAYSELELLLKGLVGPACLGMEVTVFDPDFDPDGIYAHDIVNALVATLAAPRPSLVEDRPSRVDDRSSLVDEARPVIPAQPKRVRARRSPAQS